MDLTDFLRILAGLSTFLMALAAVITAIRLNGKIERVYLEVKSGNALKSGAVLDKVYSEQIRLKAASDHTPDDIEHEEAMEINRRRR